MLIPCRWACYPQRCSACVKAGLPVLKDRMITAQAFSLTDKSICCILWDLHSPLDLHRLWKQRSHMIVCFFPRLHCLPPQTTALIPLITVTAAHLSQPSPDKLSRKITMMITLTHTDPVNHHLSLSSGVAGMRKNLSILFCTPWSANWGSPPSSLHSSDPYGIFLVEREWVIWDHKPLKSQSWRNRYFTAARFIAAVIWLHSLL